MFSSHHQEKADVRCYSPKIPWDATSPVGPCSQPAFLSAESCPTSLRTAVIMSKGFFRNHLHPCLWHQHHTERCAYVFLPVYFVRVPHFVVIKVTTYPTCKCNYPSLGVTVVEAE